MTKTAMAAVFAALMGTSAHAADMPTKAPPSAPIPAVATNWAGFYIGGNAGGGVAIADFFDPDCFTCNDGALSGGFAVFGGQAGYNWQFGHAVVGIEGDLDWQSFRRGTGLIEGQELTTTKLDASASLRLRTGLAFDRTLAYLTFGPAWAHANSQSTLFNFPSIGSPSQTTDRHWLDGIVAGAGIEYQIAPNWALRGEYLHLDFRDSIDILLPVFIPPAGRKNYAYSEELARLGLDYQFGGGTLSASAAAPVIGKASAMATPTAAAGWSGFYLGGNVGGGMAEAQFLDPDCYICGNASYHRGFAAIGGQMGYDAQWNSLVLGAVGDIDWTSLDQSGVLGIAQNSSEGGETRVRMNALASLRARAGLAVDRTLFYVTAGPAFGHFDTSTLLFPATFPLPPSFTTPDRVAAEDTWRLGLAAGAGLEVVVDPHWSLFGEYLLYEFGSTDVRYQPQTTKFVSGAGIIYGYSAQVARIGANYRFNAREPSESTPILFKTPAVAASWQGFYLGGNAGEGLFNGDAMEMDCFLCASMTTHIPFAVLGVQGGYNWQWGATVLGLEADIDWASVNSSRAFGLSDLPNGFERQKMDAFDSLRARAGLAMDKSLLYVTAGPAIGQFKENTFFQGTPIAYPTSGWQPGLAAGAGIAYKLDPQWSIRAEYLHLAFTDKIVNCGANFVFGIRNCLLSRVQYANTADVARLGIDYAFK
jgi:opacity protein-like surface antigen